MPVALSWDGAVSALRAYREDELLALAHRADAGGTFEWRAGTIGLRTGHMTYLLGIPRSEGRSDHRDGRAVEERRDAVLSHALGR
jgi:hypothetical protein